MCVPGLLTFLRAPPKEYNQVMVIAHALPQKRTDYLIFVGVGEFSLLRLSVYYCLCGDCDDSQQDLGYDTSFALVLKVWGGFGNATNEKMTRTPTFLVRSLLFLPPSLPAAAPDLRKEYVQENGPAELP